MCKPLLCTHPRGLFVYLVLSFWDGLASTAEKLFLRSVVLGSVSSRSPNGVLTAVTP